MLLFSFCYWAQDPQPILHPKRRHNNCPNQTRLLSPAVGPSSRPNGQFGLPFSLAMQQARPGDLVVAHTPSSFLLLRHASLSPDCTHAQLQPRNHAPAPFSCMQHAGLAVLASSRSVSSLLPTSNASYCTGPISCMRRYLVVQPSTPRVTPPAPAPVPSHCTCHPLDELHVVPRP